MTFPAKSGILGPVRDAGPQPPFTHDSSSHQSNTPNREPLRCTASAGGVLCLFCLLCMRQPCGKYGEYDLRVHLCAQPLDGSFGQPQGTLGLLALLPGHGGCPAAPPLPRPGGPAKELPHRPCLFVGGQQHGGGVAVARLRGPPVPWPCPPARCEPCRGPP